MEIPLTVHNVDRWLHPTAFYKQIKFLKKTGYSLDFASDKMLEESKFLNNRISVGPNGAKYKVLVIPACSKMPVSTMNQVIRLANEGATILIQQLPVDVPGLMDLQTRRAHLKNILSKLMFSANDHGLRTCNAGKGSIVVGNITTALTFSGIYPEKIVSTGLQFIRRKLPGGTYYFIVNHTANDIDQTVFLQNPAITVLLMNPLNGTISKLAHGMRSTETAVRLKLKSGESVILKLSNKNETAPGHRYSMMAGTPMYLQYNSWTLHFNNGGPIIPAVRQMTGIRPWTSFTGDTTTQSFSGTGVYTTTFTIKNKAENYLLQFDNIYESARIIINGKDAGLIWCLPYELRVGKYLKEGSNTISIEVCNLMANRIREMDRRGDVWRNYHEINFVNINYQPFDASRWKVLPSGIDSEVTLIPLR